MTTLFCVVLFCLVLAVIFILNTRRDFCEECDSNPPKLMYNTKQLCLNCYNVIRHEERRDIENIRKAKLAEDGTQCRIEFPGRAVLIKEDNDSILY